MKCFGEVMRIKRRLLQSAVMAIATLGGLQCFGATDWKEASWEFFNDPTVRTFQFEVSEQGLMSLRRRQPNYVKGTMREGNVLLANVGIRLKGMGSFRPVFEK